MFSICLISNKSLSQVLKSSEDKNYDSELDDETSVIFDICNIFEETGIIKFLVSGFGQDEWPVDCRFDLPGIMEDLPKILNEISQGDYNFELNFYEQGIEREIIFKDNGNDVNLICVSRTNWRPNPSAIEIKKEDVKKQFTSLYNNFILYSKHFCVSLINNTLLKSWVNSSEG